jgi:hypothetical protein
MMWRWVPDLRLAFRVPQLPYSCRKKLGPRFRRDDLKKEALDLRVPCGESLLLSPSKTRPIRIVMAKVVAEMLCFAFPL